MPRTSVVESPGCPPIRALTFDILGFVKVVEARGKQGGVAKVVDRWGDPDSSKSVLAASIHDRQFNPLLAVARKSGVIEVLSPVNGDLHVSLPNVSQADIRPEDDPIAGLHLFKKRGSELSSRSCTLLTCSTTGHASLMSVDFSKSLGDSISSDTPKTWNVCGAGNITCSKVDEKEKYALFGGKGVEVNVWDIENCTQVWTAKSPAKNSLDIFTPTWFTSATFLNKDDHRKLVAGTNSHQVRLYDISAQRRPVISFDFRETPIRAVAEDIDGYTVYAGNGSGDLASFDMRTGKLLGCFLGKCSGSIRSIARHPQLPVIASCGLDSYLRVWDIKSRQLLSAVFLKQHLTNVVFDSQFSDEEFAGAAAPTPLNESRELNEIRDENEEDSLPLKRKKTSKEHIGSKNKKSKKKVNEVVDGDGDEEQSLPVTQKKGIYGTPRKQEIKIQEKKQKARRQEN